MPFRCAESATNQEEVVKSEKQDIKQGNRIYKKKSKENLQTRKQERVTRKQDIKTNNLTVSPETDCEVSDRICQKR